MKMKTILRKDIREWLKTPRAAELANGAASTHREYELLSDLSMHWTEHSVVKPLTIASRQRLARLIADPEQEVIDDQIAAIFEETGGGKTDRVWVDANAIECLVLYHKTLRAGCWKHCRGDHPHVTVEANADGKFYVRGQSRLAGIHTSGGEFSEVFESPKEAVAYAKRMVA
jgi:hypothetical protein